MYTEMGGDGMALCPVSVKVIVKNGRVVVCKVFMGTACPSYLQYHPATGWRDLQHGDTALSKRMPSIAPDPFALG